MTLQTILSILYIFSILIVQRCNFAFALRVPRPQLRIGVFATDGSVDLRGHVHGGVLYMSNLISVLSSFADVGVFVLSRSCLSAAQLLSDETMQHRYDLFHRPNVTRIDLSDLRTVRQARDAPPLNGRICGISPNSEKLQSLVLPLFFRNLSLDVLLFRTQRLRPMSNNSATVVRVLMPTVTSLLSTPEASIPNGRAWIVYMNSHIDSNANFTAQLSRWVVQRQHRVLFQETGQVQFAVNALGSFNSSVLWAPPIGAVRNLDNTRPKVHPRGARPLTHLLLWQRQRGIVYLSNDLVLGFADCTAAATRLDSCT
jgi:hypothetical protein